VKGFTGPKKINTEGCCQSGFIEPTALAYLAAAGDESVTSAAFFATHQDFTNALVSHHFIYHLRADTST